MELINGRYRITDIVEEKTGNVYYEAADLFDKDRKYMIKIFNYSNLHPKIFEHYEKKFKIARGFNHPNMLKIYDFDIVYEIDNKKLKQKESKRKYIFVKELFEAKSLYDTCRKFKFEDIVDIFLKMCRAVEYVNAKGCYFLYLNPKNIYLNEENEIKIDDWIAVRELGVRGVNNEIIRYSMAPEINIAANSISENTDVYSIGMTAYYILTTNKIDYDDEKIKLKTFMKIIKKMVSSDQSRRYKDFREVIKDIYKMILEKEEDIEDRYKEKLNFETPVIARESEIKEIIKIDEDYRNKIYKNKMVLINGESGSGKTRILEEIEYELRMRGRIPYRLNFSEDLGFNRSDAAEMLKNMIREAPKKLIDKYGSELIKIIPEISEIADITPSTSLSQEKESLRLYNRIANFIEDFSEEEPIYVLIDNLDYKDKTMLEFIDYVMSNIEISNVLIIITYDKDCMDSSFKEFDYWGKWSSMDGVLNLKISKFNLEETAEHLKNIFGMKKKPMKFATRILSETGGNPRHTEEIVKNLYSRGEIFIGKKGTWSYESENHSKIYIPSDVDFALEEQMKSLEKKLLEVLEVISIFNTSISKEIIKKMREDESYLGNVISTLVSMKLLEERVEDWGYTYDFYSIQKKNYVYHMMKEEKKIYLHKRAASILEKRYIKENRFNAEELIYHLKKSKQTDKAIAYAIRFAKKMKNLKVTSQSINLWENARQLMEHTEHKRKMEVLMNLGNLYLESSKINKAEECFKESLKIANKNSNLRLMADSQNKIAQINYKRGDLENALEFVESARDISEKIDYVDGILSSQIILNRIDFFTKGNRKVLDSTKKYIEIARNKGKKRDEAQLLNHMGLSNMFLGNISEAEKNFTESMELLIEIKEIVEATKSMNNLGELYMKYYEDLDKAMYYFKKGLEIAYNYNSSESILYFLNNIGEYYIIKDEYYKAKRYIKKAVNLAEEIEHYQAKFVGNTNLAILYMNMGEYDKCFRYKDILNKTFVRDMMHEDYISRYFEFLQKFYMKFADYKKALSVSEEVIKNNKYFNLRDKLIAKGIKMVVSSSRDKKIDKEEIEKLRHEFSNTKYYAEKRHHNLYFAHNAYSFGDIDYAKKILEEDLLDKNIFNTDFLELYRAYFKMQFEKMSIDEMEKWYKVAKEKKLPTVELAILVKLGEVFFEKEEYYKSIDYYVTAIDLLATLTNKIPDGRLKRLYAIENGAVELRDSLAKIEAKILNEKKEEIKSRRLKDLFDVSKVYKILENEKFYKNISQKYTHEIINGINNAEDIIKSLTKDNKRNLEIVLRYAMAKVLAERGCIYLKDEETEELSILISSDEMDQNSEEKILNMILQNKEGFIIKSPIKEQKNNLYRTAMESRIKSSICMPIYRYGSDVEKPYERRQREKEKQHEIVGYVYMDTSRLFNRFDEDMYEEIKYLSNLIFLNILNYKLKEISSIDKLTKAYTRKFTDIMYNDTIIYSEKNSKEFSVLMIDIDKFKGVNDTYGHQKGDEVLSKVAEIIKNSIRYTDILGRYGGEEFIAILPTANEKIASEIAENIRKNIEEANLMGKDYPLTVSIGISTYPKHGQEKEELIEKADQALYHAKEEGRNKVSLWSNKIGKKTKRLDKLAGIISGNTVQNQRNMLVIMEIISLIKENTKSEEKIYIALGRIIETLEAMYGSIFILKPDKTINEVYSRKRFEDKLIENQTINQNIISRVIASEQGEYLIDWETVSDKDVITGKPNWNSIIVLPLVYKGIMKGIIQISVPIKEKEFDYNSYNFVSLVGDIIAAII